MISLDLSKIGAIIKTSRCHQHEQPTDKDKISETKVQIDNKNNRTIIPNGCKRSSRIFSLTQFITPTIKE